MAMQETIYVGLDLGSSVCQQTVMSGDGVRRFSRVIATTRSSGALNSRSKIQRTRFTHGWPRRGRSFPL